MANTAVRADEDGRPEDTEDRRHFDSEPSWPYHLPLYLYIHTYISNIYMDYTHSQTSYLELCAEDLKTTRLDLTT